MKKEMQKNPSPTHTNTYWSFDAEIRT